MKINTPGGWADVTPKKINIGGAWKEVVKVSVNTPAGWKSVFPNEAAPEVSPYLYDVAIVYAGSHVVNFTALSGYVHPDPAEEAYMFRCVEAPLLNGYVAKSFTKTFPVDGYTKYNCTLQDLSSDIPPENAKTISFIVDNK